MAAISGGMVSAALAGGMARVWRARREAERVLARLLMGGTMSGSG